MVWGGLGGAMGMREGLGMVDAIYQTESFLMVHALVRSLGRGVRVGSAMCWVGGWWGGVLGSVLAMKGPCEIVDIIHIREGMDAGDAAGSCLGLAERFGRRVGRVGVWCAVFAWRARHDGVVWEGGWLIYLCLYLCLVHFGSIKSGGQGCVPGWGVWGVG